MRGTAAFLALLVAGCGTSTTPAPEDPEPWVWVKRYAERLRKAPEDVDALRGLVLHLIECDADVMSSMRRHHGTGSAVMRHNYPTHLWIHPFTRGFLLAQQGKEDAACEEYGAAVAAATKYVETHECFGDGSSVQVAEVVAQQARRWLAAAR